MAHVAKYSKGAMGHMLQHYDRRKSGSKSNIDPTRTDLNYNLATHQLLPQLEFIQKRLSEVKVQNRKDVNVLCDWIVTVPKDLPTYEHRQFFQATYDFLETKYGKENVVSAHVHVDETTPHIHFAFVPVCYDKKKDRYKCSAKEVLTRNDLQKFHVELQEHLERELGHEVAVLNGATKEGNRSIDELRRQNATERLAEVNKEVVQKLCKAQERLDEVESVKFHTEAKIMALKGEYEEIKSKYGEMKDLINRINELEVAAKKQEAIIETITTRINKALETIPSEERRKFVRAYNEQFEKDRKVSDEPFRR